MICLLLLLLLTSNTMAFLVQRPIVASTGVQLKRTFALQAVKKKVSAAVPTTLWDDEDDTPSLKDLKKAAKKGKQKPSMETAVVIPDTAATTAENPTAAEEPSEGGKNEKMSKRDAMLLKALALEQADANGEVAAEGASEKLSGKELKALKKKEEKMAAKLEKKKAKKTGTVDDDDDSDDRAEDATTNGATTEEPMDVDATDTRSSPPLAEEVEVTLEDKIRKERPPPRIRVMDNVQAGYTSLRLENVGITFRNQEVLRDVTWGVQTGDRIGLVGANGAGTCPFVPSFSTGYIFMFFYIHSPR